MTSDELKSELMCDKAFCRKLKMHLLKDDKFHNIFYEPFTQRYIIEDIMLYYERYSKDTILQYDSETIKTLIGL